MIEEGQGLCSGNTPDEHQIAIEHTIKEISKDMQPKLFPDTTYLPAAGDVYVRNNRSHLMLKGKATYSWLEHLAPYLNGQHSLEELTSGLDESRKRMVTELVETLFTHHLLTDASLDQSHDLSQAELDTYAAEIAFIESFQPSAARRFELFRRMRILVIGSGISNAALIRSCLRSGIQSLSIIRTADEESVPGISAVIDDSGLLLSYDTSQQIQELAAPSWEDREMVRDVIRSFDAILHLSDQPMLARARLLNTVCVEQEKILLQACFVDDRAWIGPLVKPGIEGCWECAWRRLQGTLQEHEHLSSYGFHDHGALAPSRWFAFSAAAMAANHLVFALFKTVTEAGPLEDAEKLVSIDLETLTSRSHAFLPHPHCQACQHPPAPTEAIFLQQLNQLQQRGPLDAAAFSQRVARCFDAWSGIFTSIDEGDFEQVPLAVCQVAISNPLPLHPRAVIATGRDFKTARECATQRACEIYASTMVDVRRLVTEKTSAALEPGRFLTTTLYASSVDFWSWALDLEMGRRHLVPAPLVFSSLWPEVSTKEKTLGIGSGMSWSEAICRALLDWACYLTIAELSDASHPARKLDLLSLRFTTEGDHLLQLLQTVEARPDIYDVTGSLGIPTFAICTETQTLAYISHCDADEALVKGLELALRHYQANAAQQPAYALHPVPPLSAFLRSNRSAPFPRVAVPQAWPDRQAWLVQKFLEHGWHPLVTLLNHDPAFTEVLPFLVRILLSCEERKK